MKVTIGISNHHLHLTKEDCQILFGSDELHIRNMLNQPGQYACLEKVNVIGPKSTLENIVVVGPFRDYTQLEVSKTDARHLGIDPPVRDSGDLRNASLITIVGPCGRIEKECAIIANRHIHVSPSILKEKQLVGIKKVTIKINGEKGGIIENVYLKETNDAYFELHLDTDDANAFLLQNGDVLEIIEK